MIVYDVEIKKAIPNRSPNVPGIDYCAGWGDYANMGISVVCTYDTQKMKYGVYCDDNSDDFKELITHQNDIRRPTQTFVSYNGLSFDNKVLAACWGVSFTPERCYDVLVEIWRAHGLGADYQYPSHAGFSLDDVCVCNDLGVKSANGALAPIMWQRGLVGKVINYCLEDVRLTTKLLRRAVEQVPLVSPKMLKPFYLRAPELL